MSDSASPLVLASLVAERKQAAAVELVEQRVPKKPSGRQVLPSIDRPKSRPKSTGVSIDLDVGDIGLSDDIASSDGLSFKQRKALASTLKSGDVPMKIAAADHSGETSVPQLKQDKKRNNRVLVRIALLVALFVACAAAAFVLVINDDGSSSVEGAGGSPASTLAPTSWPSSRPTTLPTTMDTASVAMSFDVTASAPPTLSEEAALQSVLAAQIGIPVSTIKDFTVSTSRRRLGEEPVDSNSLRKLAVVWSVSFTVSTSLATVPGVATPNDLAAKLSTDLASAAFATEVATRLGATVEMASVLIVEVATRNPSRSPTLLPTANPTTQLPTATPGILTPRFDQPNIVGPGIVRLLVASEHALYRLFKLPAGTTVPMVAGRSYAGHLWEPAVPLSILFDCVDLVCEAMVPDVADGAFYIDAYNLTNRPSSREEAGRILIQATFGPTRSTITDFVENYDGSPEGWISDQMSLPATSLREFYRKRANPRLQVPTQFGGIRSPCANESRWQRFSFSELDISKVLTVANSSATGYVTLFIDGVARTEVVSSLLHSSGKYEPLVICSVLETVGGLVTIGGSCIANSVLSLTNPAVAFMSTDALPRQRLVASELPPSDLVTFATHPNLAWSYEYSSGDHMLLVDSSRASCSSIPGFGPLFVNTTEGILFMFEQRGSLVENTLERPVTVPSAASICPSVPRTFLNDKSCVTDTHSCAPTVFSNTYFVLNETTVREFYEFGGIHMHYITGLDNTFPTVANPCTSASSRWIRRPNIQPIDCTSTLDAASATVLRDALDPTSSYLQFALGTTGNDLVRDIKIGASACPAGDEVVGTKILLDDGTCWEHTHPDEYSVYDFSLWSLVHPGNKFALSGGRPNPIAAFSGSAALTFPSWHETSRWVTGKNDLSLVARLGDVINFNNLPTTVQHTEMAQHIGALSTGPETGYMSCGSPGEVASDPTLGHRALISTGSGFPNEQVLDGAELFSTRQQHSIWNTVAFEAEDQLRQRMAFFLSQIFVIGCEGVTKCSMTEHWLNYYDIFTRNAFSSYRDVLKEVSYSPDMGQMLTFGGMASYHYTKVFPDENYAREIMQLFTVGLERLHDNGTVMTDDSGNILETYDNDDIMTMARAWSGFDYQASRGNMDSEKAPQGNVIDPMQIKYNLRDQFPKMDLMDNFIGDGFPLCTDLPGKAFLRKGATYRYLGINPSPELQFDSSRICDLSDTSVVRFLLNSETSALYEALCLRSTASGECTFPATVTLNETLACVGLECDVQVVRVVQLNDKFYEYVQLPCVDFEFIEDAQTIATRGGSVADYGDQPRCGNPKAITAGCACCKESWKPERGYAIPRYSGERVSYSESVARCSSVGKLPWGACGGGPYGVWGFLAADGASTYEYDTQYFYWTAQPCSILVQVNVDGWVLVVHNPEWDFSSVGGSEFPRDHGDGNYFKVGWENGSYPLAATSCSSGCVVHGTTCVCNTTIVSEAVFAAGDLPLSADAVRSSLHVGAFDPGMFDAGTYIRCATAECTAGEPGVVVWLRSVDLDEHAIFEVVANDELFFAAQGTTRFYRNLRSTVRLPGGSGMSFRNPPDFIQSQEPTARDAHHETDAVLDHLMNHPNTAPFVAFRIIQRFVTSNPSPRYTEAVATAFKAGKKATLDLGSAATWPRHLRRRFLTARRAKRYSTSTRRLGPSASPPSSTFTYSGRSSSSRRRATRFSSKPNTTRALGRHLFGQSPSSTSSRQTLLQLGQ